MIDVLKLVACSLASVFKSRARLEAEILVLRLQLMILGRKAPPRPRVSVVDRLIFMWLYRLYPSVISAVAIVQPGPVVRWHRTGFRLYSCWKSRSRGGRPRISRELRGLIREMSLANPLWGVPRIHGELLKLGVEVAQSTVAKSMARGRRPPGQSWKTFLSNHAAAIAAMDLPVVPTIGFRFLYGLLIMHHHRRRILTVAVTAHPTAEWIARQIAEAFPWEDTPQYRLRDRDRVYGHVVRQRLAAMRIRDRPINIRSPWQNGHVERLIGSIRRECLDHVIVLGEPHLRRVLRSYADYHNRVRTHLSLDKDAPVHRAVHRTGRIAAIPMLGGLHHQYVRI
jgi:transposase InsO family protein